MKQITVVYHVVDESAFKLSGNPLQFQHHGLSAHTVAKYDAVEKRNYLRAELERLRDCVGDVDATIIDTILKEDEQ